MLCNDVIVKQGDEPILTKMFMLRNVFLKGFLKDLTKSFDLCFKFSLPKWQDIEAKVRKEWEVCHVRRNCQAFNCVIFYIRYDVNIVVC